MYNPIWQKLKRPFLKPLETKPPSPQRSLVDWKAQRISENRQMNKLSLNESRDSRDSKDQVERPAKLRKSVISERHSSVASRLKTHSITIQKLLGLKEELKAIRLSSPPSETRKSMSEASTSPLSKKLFGNSLLG